MFLIYAKLMSKCMHVAVRNAWIKHFDLNSYIFILKKSLSKLKYSCYQCFLLNGVVKLVWNHVHALPLSVNWKGFRHILLIFWVYVVISRYCILIYLKIIYKRSCKWAIIWLNSFLNGSNFCMNGCKFCIFQSN